jgi:hypothetical protein
MSASKITELWDSISRDFMEAPSTYGIARRLANKYEVDYNALRQRIFQSGLKEEREKLKNNLPVKKAIRQELSRVTAELAVKPLAKRLEETWETHNEFQMKAAEKLRADFTNYSEVEPYEFDTRLRVLEKLDQVTRKMCGITQGEDIDPAKRGIAFLAYGFEPKLANAQVIES